MSKLPAAHTLIQYLIEEVKVNLKIHNYPDWRDTRASSRGYWEIPSTGKYIDRESKIYCAFHHPSNGTTFIPVDTSTFGELEASNFALSLTTLAFSNFRETNTSYRPIPRSFSGHLLEKVFPVKAENFKMYFGTEWEGAPPILKESWWKRLFG